MRDQAHVAGAGKLSPFRAPKRRVRICAMHCAAARVRALVRQSTGPSILAYSDKGVASARRASRFASTVGMRRAMASWQDGQTPPRALSRPLVDEALRGRPRQGSICSTSAARRMIADLGKIVSGAPWWIPS